jgi:hypothetical protein
MVTRFQRALRLLIALFALGGAGAVVCEPVAAAPSAYAAALTPAASSRATATTRRAVSLAREPVRRAVALPLPLRLSAAAPRAHALRRAPRLYLRHCVLLR